MPKQKLPKPLKNQIAEYVRLSAVAKEHNNAANREKTKLRNAIKDHWTKEKLPIGSFIRSDGIEIKYEANETSAIDPERVLELYERKEINRDQFIRLLSISKSEAKNVLGGDQVADFTVTSVGNSLDIRMSDLPVERIDDEFVMENSKVKRKVKRRVFGGKTTGPKVSAPRTKTRRIKTRTKK